MASPASAVQEESSLLPAYQPAVQEPGRLPREHGHQTGQGAAGEKSCLEPWLLKNYDDLSGHLGVHVSTSLLIDPFSPSSQKDLPSEEIKTGEEDDEDNSDTLLKESNDSAF